MAYAFPLHLIVLLPLFGAAFALLIGKRVGKDAVTVVCCGSVLAAFLMAVKAVWLLHHDVPEQGALADTFFNAPWILAGDLNIAAGLVMDHLTAVMVLVVTGVGFLIHVYSSSYMEHDEGYTRFFAYLNLFMGAMLILVLGDSMLVTFVGWEGVGLCSYLLIGFWFDKEANALAGRKAFVVNRVGDFAFLLGMFLLFGTTGSLKYSDFAAFGDQLHHAAWLGQPVAFWAGLLVLIGATGKSAQIPLYVWLPDAMAGPTPVSALIHAATMVTAGVYVIARMHFVFEVFPMILAVVACIGAATALFAATIGIAQRDMKKVLAYSTISQLGFMFVGVGSHLHGSSNYQGGIFHLVTHAFFKAGLFLGAGSVMHALSGEGDITRMGGLRHKLKQTRATFWIYCMAIAGIFPFAGFWSKDAILGGAHNALWPVGAAPGKAEVFLANNLGLILYITLLVAAGCTAFYMWRLYFLVFGGEFRGTEEQEHHLHESPPAMTFVLWVLALGSILTGFLGIPESVWRHNFFAEWLAPTLPAQGAEESAKEFWMFAGIAMAVSGAGIGLAWVLYGHGFSARVRSFVAAVPRLYKTVLNKYYIDEFYDLIIVRPLRWTALILWKAVDTFVIDLFLVNGVGLLVGGVGKLIKYVQNGDVQRYVIGILVGAAALTWWATEGTARDASKWAARVEGRDVIIEAAGAGQQGKRIQYRVDWNGGHEYGALQPSPAFRHHYDSAGDKKIRVQAWDPRWNTAHEVEHKVTVK